MKMLVESAGLNVFVATGPHKEKKTLNIIIIVTYITHQIST